MQPEPHQESFVLQVQVGWMLLGHCDAPACWHQLPCKASVCHHQHRLMGYLIQDADSPKVALLRP